MTQTLCAKLHNGVLIPAVGCGTWELPDTEATSDLIAQALRFGYRHVDTASVYRNHHAVGIAVQSFRDEARARVESLSAIGDFEVVDDETFNNAFKIPHGTTDGRKIFITTKIPTDRFTPLGVKQTIEEMTQELGRSADLILLHWPGGHTAWGAPDCERTDPKNSDKRIACWRALEDAYAEGQVRAIGVSNYAEKHLIDLLEDIRTRKMAGDIKAVAPMVNQFELSPLCSPRRALLDILKNNKILVTGYSTLGSVHHSVLKDTKVRKIAQKLGKSPSQIIIRWCLQNGYLCIPRTSNIEHARENYNFNFELSPQMMDEINSLHCGHRRCPDPLDFA